VCADPGEEIEEALVADPDPLADGATNRVGRLKAYGNAIVPIVAAVFIRAFLDSEEA
jgi:hypothetical protein